jgi:shikimate kinase
MKNYKIFEELSKRVGADVDKIVFEKDEKELKKMNRNLLKETMKERTRIIEEQKQ